MAKSHTKIAFLCQYFPIFEWLPKYQLSWLRADITAGLTAWAVMVPIAMAYAGIAGVPALMGLYTVPFPLFIYSLLGTSRTMVVGPDSATALVSSVTVGAVAISGSTEYVALTSAIAIIVGLFFILFGVLKMGWVADFIPTPVMKGFVQGLVWVTIIGQIPKLLGIQGGAGNFWQKLAAIIEQLPQAHWITTLIGLISLLILWVLKTHFPKFPSALTVVILSSLVVSLCQLDGKEIELIGSIQEGLPLFRLPAVSFSQMQGVIAGSLAIVLLGYAESLGAATAAAEKTGEEIDPNQELISLGPANLAAGLSSGFLVVGSLSQTSVAISSGAKTQIASVINGVLVLLTLLFLMPLFRNLPYTTLAAIVIEAMLSLGNFNYFKNLRRIHRNEFWISLLAFGGVLFLNVLSGISLGVITSLLLLIYRASHPESSVLGQIPHTEMYRNTAFHPEAITIPGLLIFRFGNGLIFPNASYFRHSLKQKIRESSIPVKMVLIDAETMTIIDSTAMEMLNKLNTELVKMGIILAWSRLRDPVYQQMAKVGLTQKMGEENFHDRITDGVQAFLAQKR